MTERTSQRHNLPVALVLTALLLIGTAGAAGATLAQPGHRPGGTAGRTRAATHVTATRAKVPAKICPIDWRKGPWFVRKLIVCAARHTGVPGGVGEALYIANRESHFHAHAYNAWSGAMGIYQHLRRYWPGRARAYGFRGWSGFNARANVFVTMRMVRRLGNWTPWGV